MTTCYAVNHNIIANQPRLVNKISLILRLNKLPIEVGGKKILTFLRLNKLWAEWVGKKILTFLRFVDIITAMERGICYIIGAAEGRVDLKSNSGDLVIAADGGLSRLREANITPDIVIGDFDSEKIDNNCVNDGFCLEKIDEEGRRGCLKNVIALSPQKDVTDTLAAMQIGIKRGFKQFVFYCCTGGRLSHTAANIQCLNYLAKRGLNGALVDKNATITAICNTTLVVNKNGGYFAGSDQKIVFCENCGKNGKYLSVFALDRQAQGVTLQGVKYPLSNYTLTNSNPIGVSNEITGQTAQITVKKGSLLVILNEFA